jgi:signal transduction histidine kinase
LASAREVLRAAGVEAQFPGAVDIVESDLHELFGWVVREGTTNVVRHARAATCTITFGPDWIEIVDDGRSGLLGPGSGLTGLRERVTSYGGTTEAGGSPRGWRIRVDVPPGPQRSQQRDRPAVVIAAGEPPESTNAPDAGALDPPGLGTADPAGAGEQVDAGERIAP